MSIYCVYRVVKEDASIDDAPEWWVVDTRAENERDGALVKERAATKPEADEIVARLNANAGH
ncbi:hypothetical protein ACGK9R_05760 [Halomonas sp. HNIBRBA4712]|uniref:hypothetical protein n=1 Tax=Halomonas sp. HNIBRBA4712 TaxID=3373087 RepID=UPI003746CB0F